MQYFKIFSLFTTLLKAYFKNYCLISVLLVGGKIFEKLRFSKTLRFFIENDLIQPNQSGFKPGDSCINQLLPIIHDICKFFDCGCEDEDVLLNISKACDKVWNDGIIFKLEQNGISATLQKLLHDVLVNRKGSFEWVSLFMGEF